MGIPSTSENEDHFGVAAAVLDADGNGSPEVYVGGNGEDHCKGRVWKPATGSSGVTGTGATSFHPGTLGGPVGRGNFGYRFVGRPVGRLVDRPMAPAEAGVALSRAGLGRWVVSRGGGATGPSSAPPTRSSSEPRVR
ncbi:hypothetical protein [Streptomyces sp. NPDC050564]|uniref:hypothetical protein n=1 Tax=Streptomyces sp. NPDC050564 TaxID=3365631 RepID=UPI00378DEE95